MIGMVAFIADARQVLQIRLQPYLFKFISGQTVRNEPLQKTAAAILVLLVFLLIMNLTAIILRKKFEVRY